MYKGQDYVERTITIIGCIFILPLCYSVQGGGGGVGVYCFISVRPSVNLSLISSNFFFEDISSIVYDRKIIFGIQVVQSNDIMVLKPTFLYLLFALFILYFLLTHFLQGYRHNRIRQKDGTCYAGSSDKLYRVVGKRYVQFVLLSFFVIFFLSILLRPITLP